LQTNTLRAYIEGLGGKLKVIAEFGDGETYLIAPFSSPSEISESVPQYSITALLEHPQFQAGVKSFVREVQKG
ncbi:MAG TPA: hypothetical protein PLW99_03690, partial [Candidatus Paceibacterota bacterium]|nr:hypothetical protein [Candidatus Paceibacterota bacterium]